jgi:hypothetical protein
MTTMTNSPRTRAALGLGLPTTRRAVTTARAAVATKRHMINHGANGFTKGFSPWGFPV